MRGSAVKPTPGPRPAPPDPQRPPSDRTMGDAIQITMQLLHRMLHLLQESMHYMCRGFRCGLDLRSSVGWEGVLWFAPHTPTTTAVGQQWQLVRRPVQAQLAWGGEQGDPLLPGDRLLLGSTPCMPAGLASWLGRGFWSRSAGDSPDQHPTRSLEGMGSGT